ncbi:MAG: M56 family metallopeptidase [Bacteroides fragilis]
MSEVFLKTVNMSISASWIVLVIFILRLLLRKAPKWIMVLLWCIVALRLICPFSIESSMSLIPSTETINPEISVNKTLVIAIGIPIVDNTINPIIRSSIPTASDAGASPLQIWIPILAMIWVVGILLLLAYTVISFQRVKKKIETAVLLRDNIYQSETVIFPFVFGIIKPNIYLPFNMKEHEMEHAIVHEQAHIRRKDYLWKPFGFLILTIHWFNPIIWLGYMLLCRDIELACDEKVVKEMNTVQRADYSQALLTYSVRRRIGTTRFLAFGEVGVKDRVKSVLNYKKPTRGIAVFTMMVGVVLAFCFLTNPISDTNNEYSWEDIVQGESVYPIQPGTEEWEKLGTVQNKKEACRIPCTILKEMTDEELIRAVLDYPFLVEIFLVDDHSIGAKNVYNDCDALQELLSRHTGGMVLTAFMNERAKVSSISADEEFENDAIRIILEELVH